MLLPALSPTMEMGTIVSWAKKEGENTIMKKDPLCIILQCLPTYMLKVLLQIANSHYIIQ